MRVNLELDGEPISIEQSSPSDRSTGLNQREDFPYFNDSFNNADGVISQADSEGRIRMVAAVAGQNTPNYFDQDNFYPVEGLGVVQNVKGYFGEEQSKERRKLRQDTRKARKIAKTNEIQSRADLNKAAGTESESDIALAKALSEDKKSTGLSNTTKIVIGVGVVAVLGAIAYFVIKKNN